MSRSRILIADDHKHRQKNGLQESARATTNGGETLVSHASQHNPQTSFDPGVL